MCFTVNVKLDLAVAKQNARIMANSFPQRAPVSPSSSNSKILRVKNNLLVGKKLFPERTVKKNLEHFLELDIWCMRFQQSMPMD